MLTPDGKFVCGICKREMNDSKDPTTKDCGGDCLRCMAEAGDPDCAAEMEKLNPKSVQLLDACYIENGEQARIRCTVKRPANEEHAENLVEAAATAVITTAHTIVVSGIGCHVGCMTHAILIQVMRKLDEMFPGERARVNVLLEQEPKMPTTDQFAGIDLKRKH